MQLTTVEELLDTDFIQAQFYNDAKQYVEISHRFDFELKRVDVLCYDKETQNYCITFTPLGGSRMTVSGSNMFSLENRPRKKTHIICSNTEFHTRPYARGLYLLKIDDENTGNKRVLLTSFLVEPFTALLLQMQANDWKLPFLENLIENSCAVTAGLK